jgi:hypothetical protein
MKDLAGINISSVVIHKLFAINDKSNIYIGDASKTMFLDLSGYQCYVVMSGKYKNGEGFSREEIKISMDSYNEMRQYVLWPEYKGY